MLECRPEVLSTQMLKVLRCLTSGQLTSMSNAHKLTAAFRNLPKYSCASFVSIVWLAQELIYMWENMSAIA